MPDKEQKPVTRHELESAVEMLTAAIVQNSATLTAAIAQNSATLTAAIVQNSAQLKSEILAATQEFVRDAQTEILRGFHAFAVTNEARLLKMQGDVKNIDASTDTRIRALEQRLMQIETKLMLNPPRPQ